MQQSIALLRQRHHKGGRSAAGPGAGTRQAAIRTLSLAGGRCGREIGHGAHPDHRREPRHRPRDRDPGPCGRAYRPGHVPERSGCCPGQSGTGDGCGRRHRRSSHQGCPARRRCRHPDARDPGDAADLARPRVAVLARDRGARRGDGGEGPAAPPRGHRHRHRRQPQALSTLENVAKDLALGAIYRDKSLQETIIRNSGLDWTIVRPTFLTGSSPHRTLPRPRRARHVAQRPDLPRRRGRLPDPGGRERDLPAARADPRLLNLTCGQPDPIPEAGRRPASA
jgi:hypothetical protein